MRLIDADILEDKFDLFEGGKILAVTSDEIKLAQTVDAQPVVHAKWIVVKEEGFSYIICSKCESECPQENNLNWRSTYCPSCGAKMDL